MSTIVDIRRLKFKARDARRITAAVMKHMTRTAGYIWDRLQNKYTQCKEVKK
jgi:hypothetical protein